MNTINRNQYGEIITANGLNSAADLVKKAEKSKKIPASYDMLKRDRKGRFDGSALHHEIYDFTTNAVLVCMREADGTSYGVKTVSKNYVIIRKCGRGVMVIPANKAIAAKAAKSSGALGEAIATCEGKRKLTVAAMQKRIGYKLVVRTDDGRYVSAWDQSEWPIGKTRTERASETHGHGGFYYYRDMETALNAAVKNDTFGRAREHHNLAVIEVEVSGREYEFDGVHYTKYCATRIRPLRDIASTL